MDESCWRLEGTVARLAIGDCRATIDLTRPAQGLTLQWPDALHATPPRHILGVQFEHAQSVDARRMDAYVRGDDLVATYDEVDPRRVRAQIYWRRIKAAEFSPKFAEHVAAALDLIVSVNTSLLDSDPQSSVISTISSAGGLLCIVDAAARPSGISTKELAVGAVSRDHARGFLVRPTSGEISYAEIVHPAESCRSEARWLTGFKSEESRAVQIQEHLFQQRLEKGVILRAWIRVALLARKHDEAAAMSAYQHFAAAEPPLTV